MNIPGYDAWKLMSPDDERLDDDYCPNCGGDGVVYMCLDEIGCIDPEGGCDLCERICDWCGPRRAERDPDQWREERDEAKRDRESDR